MLNYKVQFRQLSTFPGSRPPSIIDVKELNFRVRDGNGWDLFAIVTGFLSEVVPSKLNNVLHLKDSSLSLIHIYILYLLELNRFALKLWSSPRTISINQLNMLPHLHL